MIGAAEGERGPSEQEPTPAPKCAVVSIQADGNALNISLREALNAPGDEKKGGELPVFPFRRLYAVADLCFHADDDSLQQQ
jgi:hypothetical protein